MNGATSVETTIGGKTIKFETGLLAKQAAGAATIQIGDSIVFAAVTTTKEPRAGVDFLPLQIEYREKFYASGKFPGGYFKREARPSEREILTMRVTDRPLRPLFKAGFYNDVQINAMVMSADREHETDMQCVNLASCVLTLSEIPFMGPVGAVRIGRINGELIIEPTVSQIAESDMDLVYVGTKDKTMMIEGEAEEIPEADMIAAMKVAHEAIQPIIEAQLELRRKMGLPDKVVEEDAKNTAWTEKAKELIGEELGQALTIPGKLERSSKVHELKDQLEAPLREAFPEMEDNDFFLLFDDLEIELVRNNVLQHKKRIDGRAFDELRPLAGEVGVLPRVHGSAMFARGETQTIATLTLGTKDDAQSMDSIVGGPTSKPFILHYNFPPYSVGEAGRLGATSRREIGHGNLAERSLSKVAPADYPYAIRIVSEIMGSNGSTSMASVCGGTLAMMDAGIPISKPVAGISVGLFTAENQSELVLDILGTEDHCGDMDFKVCGTRDGITGFQVDMKIHGLDWDQVEGAFSLAYTGRQQILDFMDSVMPAPRAEMSPYAPRMEVMTIDTEKIGAVIGPGGKMIRGITERCGVEISIEDDGTVTIYGTEKESVEAAMAEVNGLTAEAERGKIYNGVVTGVKDFGAFVEILPGIDGLVHISELEHGRVEKVEDVLNMGDEVQVKCLDIDDRGKVKLSRKALLEREEV